MLVERFLFLASEEYKRSFIAQQLTANLKMTSLQLFNWFYDQRGIIATEEEIIKIRTSLLNTWTSDEETEKPIKKFQ